MDLDKSYLCSETGSPCRIPIKTPIVNVGWTWKLILAGISTTIGSSIPVGFTIGVVNTPAPIKAWCNESAASRYNIILNETALDNLWASIVSIFLVGGMIGSLGGAWVADRVGRKGALIVSGSALLIAAFMFIISKPLNSLEIILLGRVVAGLGSGCVTAVMPMYLTELAPASIRGAMGVLCPLGLTSGVLVAQLIGFPNILGTEHLWNYLLGCYAVSILISAAALPFLPESPKYLYAVKNLKEKAIKELSSLRQLPPEIVCYELEEKVADVEHWSILKLLKNRPLRTNLALVCALQAGQQFSGINAVFYYSTEIFKKAGLTEQNAQLASLGAASTNLLMALIMIPIVNHFPRRSMVVGSCTFASVFLVFLAICMNNMNASNWMPYLSIASISGYIIAYNFGLGPIPFFIGAELFPLGPRSAAMALGSVSNWSGNFIVGMTFLQLYHLMDSYSFMLFALSTVLLTCFVKICLPETNERVFKDTEIRRFSLTKHPSGSI